MRSWSIRVYLLDESGKEVPATLFEKAVYKLHPSFKNPVQGESFLGSLTWSTATDRGSSG